MNKQMTMNSFTALRAEFPSLSPADLFDTACARLGRPDTWATASWMLCSLWMDAFANAPTSYQVQ